MSGPDVGDPIPHRFVDCLLESGLASGDRNHLRPEKSHPSDIEGLPFHIDLAHVNDAFAPEPGCDGCGGNPVLAGTRFSDDATFSHPLGEKDLAERIVNLVCAGVEQVFALEINLWTT